jgi:hypothetical protein
MEPVAAAIPRHAEGVEIGVRSTTDPTIAMSTLDSPRIGVTSLAA